MGKIISIGELIDKSWDHYVAHFKKLMGVSLWAFLVPVVATIRLLIIPNGEVPTLALILNDQGTAWNIFGVIIGSIISFIIIPIISIWIYINFIKTIESQATNQPYSLKAIRVYGIRNLFSYIWVALLKAIVTAIPLLALIPGLIIIYLNIYKDGGALWGAISLVVTLIGILVALIFIIMLGVQLAFSPYERLIANRRGKFALGGSRVLVKDRFWPVLWRYTIPKILFALIVGFMSILAMAISLGLFYAFYSVNDVLAMWVYVIAFLILSTGVAVLTTPIFTIADYYLYDSLNEIRK